jgi:hypothetical protein
MPSNESADPTVQEADQRAARAKASLLSRVELLKHKLTDTKQKLDLPAQIALHPLPAVGIAFALGVLAGLRHTSPVRFREPGGRSLKHAAITALAAIGLRMVRDLAFDQLGLFAKQWWTARDGKAARPGHAPRMADAGRFQGR